MNNYIRSVIPVLLYISNVPHYAYDIKDISAH